MSKPLVLFLSLWDWANSTYEACQAVRSAGRYDARHVVLSKHPFNYPVDILCPLVGTRAALEDVPLGRDVLRLLADAELIHLWNCDVADFSTGGINGRVLSAPFPLPVEKVKSCTWAGTLMRNFHSYILSCAQEHGRRVAVEDPTFAWEGEYRPVFIPHAVDTERLRFAPLKYRIPGSIGIYNPGRSYYDRDLAMLRQAALALGDGARIVMDRRPVDWLAHIAELSRCWLFFQSMDEDLGTCGRSALEAASLGILALSHISDRAAQQVRAGFRDVGCPITCVTRHNLENAVKALLSLSHSEYEERCCQGRQWCERFYGYQVVGTYYSDFFDEVRSGIA